MDRAAFTLERPQSSKGGGGGLVRVLASPPTNLVDSSNKSTPLQPENNGKMSRAQTRSSIDQEKGALSRYVALFFAGILSCHL